VARLSGVTVKTLYHYHKIGLLEPENITESGYRLYGDEQINRLQQILFYRELKFPLIEIKRLLVDDPNRLSCLQNQQALLRKEFARLETILATLETTIRREMQGDHMETKQMFNGLNKQEWEAALSEQNEYLKKEYGYDMLTSGEIEPEKLNEQSDEVTHFMTFMADSLRKGRKANDDAVKEAIERHITFVNEKVYPTTAQSFVDEAEFFLTDDFHRSVFENHQIGLAYYIFVAAKMYAADKVA
jgi:DNA-binding transcriptional MerR regulator